MIALDGVKMSKSLGNLVFVHKLTEEGHDPSAIRLAVFAGHYRQDRDFSSSLLTAAGQRLDRWRERLAQDADESRVHESVAKLKEALALDLDTPSALEVIDQAPGDHDGVLTAAIDSLLGVQL